MMSGLGWEKWHIVGSALIQIGGLVLGRSPHQFVNLKICRLSMHKWSLLNLILHECWNACSTYKAVAY